ncbi:serine/threonine protein kinase, CMGC, dual-specificity [Microbotryomycetes sp. JL221]|nr:serine/threonine protein kinase, CMGC, dual-specificity [Microbotryomycetes sp. JL221]
MSDSSPRRRTLSTRAPSSSSSSSRAAALDSSSSLSRSPALDDHSTVERQHTPRLIRDNIINERSSIGHAVRVQLSSASPVVHHHQSTLNLASTTLLDTDSTRHTKPISAHTYTTNQSSPRSQPSLHSSPRLSNFQSPAPNSTLANTGPHSPRQASAPASPRVSSLADTIARTGSSPRPVKRQIGTESPRASSNTPSAAAAASSSSSTFSSSSSPRRKPPAPLQLDQSSHHHEDDTMERDARSQSKQTISRSAKESPRSTTKRWTSSIHTGFSNDSTTMTGSSSSLHKSPSKSEARDTLSSLQPFPSPFLGTSIPSASLDVSSSDFAAANHSPTIPQQASSPSTAIRRTSDSRQNAFASSSGSSQGFDGVGSRHYSGVGLGLPFSASASANLSSLANAPVSPSQVHRFSMSAQPNMARRRSSVETSLDPNTLSEEFKHASFDVESPVIDRTNLVGLGELATPRWTSSVLERKWATPLDSARRKSDDSASKPSSMSRRQSQDVMPSMSRKHHHSPRTSQRAVMADASSFTIHPTALFPETTAMLKTPKSAPIGRSSGDLDSFGGGSAAFGEVERSYDDVTDAGPEEENKFESMAMQNRRSLNVSAIDWTGSTETDITGLGFDYDAAHANLVDKDTPRPTTRDPQRRTSTGSTSSRRSSFGRSNSIDAKLPSKTMAVRRHSTSKASFAHLPPSPAAPSSYLLGSNEQPPPLPTTGSFQTLNQVVSTPSIHSTPGKTTDSAARYVRQSHQSSPSLIAASILKHSRENDGGHLDVESTAAVDQGTAEALRKLDGLSSPRLSKIAAGSTASSNSQQGNASSSAPNTVSRSRNASRASNPTTPPAMPRRDSGDEVKSTSRRRARNSIAGPSTRDSLRPQQQQQQDSFRSTGMSSAGGSSSAGSSPAIPHHSPTIASQVQRSPLSSHSQASPHIPQLSSRPGSSHNDSMNAVQSTLNRASASSSSVQTGMSTSNVGSQDSTSATSFMSGTNRSSFSSKNRRGSIGSDGSSIHSWGAVDGVFAPRFERQDSGGAIDGESASDIPPVPPLPKDLDSFRQLPTAASMSSISAYSSPRIDAATDHQRQIERQPSRDVRNFEQSNAVEHEPPHHQTRHVPRKWSISGAFSRSGKSPKSPALPESASFSELPGVSRERKSSFGGHLSDVKRMVSSSNDIVGLAGGHENKHRESRSRTTSQSSSSTTKTSNTTTNHNITTPAVITTSPGRSRSSLLNPRRTPSGIPFFSRKNSSSSSNALPQTPAQQTVEDVVSTDDRSGRKSILGLGFLRPGSSKREKSSTSLKSGSMSSSSAASTSNRSPSTNNLAGFDEFGAKVVVESPGKASTLGGAPRRRGKTVGANDDSATLNIKPAQLPPMQVSPLPAFTAQKIDSMESLAQVATDVNPSTFDSTSSFPNDRVARLQASTKGTLPTIVGSPSSKPVALAGDVPRHISSSLSPPPSPPPSSRTPTKIPRLLPQRAAGSFATERDVSPSAPPAIPIRSAHRRPSSHQGTTPDLSLQSTSASSSSTGVSESDSLGPNGEQTANDKDNATYGVKPLATRKRLDTDSQIPRSRSSTLVGPGKQSQDAATPAVVTSGTASSSSSAIKSRRRRSGAPIDDSVSASVHRGVRTASLQTPRLSDSRTQPTVSSVRKISVKGPDSIAASRRVSGPIGKLDSSTSSSSLSASTTRAVKSIASKVSLQTRLPRSSTAPALSSMTSDSGRSSAGSYRPQVTEDEILGDEEMAAYVKRQKASKAAAGTSNETIRKMFEFPDPIEPSPALDFRDALALYNRSLTPYEQEEIRQFDSVYFVGPNADKKRNTLDNPTNNFGYDDDRGDYLVISHDQIQYRYEITDVLGKGSFGQVLQCRDHKTGDMVAIKIIRNKKRFHHQALVEIKVLENLVKWDPDEKHFVIRMVDSFTWRGHLCIVTELLSINLYELVKANSFAGFSTNLIRRFTIQILGSLSLLRHHRVVHCDLKPENILLKHPAKSAIKVIDFGSSCFEHEKVYTYIQSRFYRSPEVILGMNYHMAIDMWSLGCIIAEMYTGYPIFPGENEQEQLGCIMEVMGVPEKYLIDRSSRRRLFFDSTGAPRPVVNSKGRRRRPGTKSLGQVLKTNDELFVDFIAKCLIWDPERRLKPDAALRHPWIVAARGRPISPSAPSSRSNRNSLTTSQTSGGHGSTTSSPLSSSINNNNGGSNNISTPRRKVISILNTSTSSSSISAAASNTSSTRGARTQSTSAASAGGGSTTARLSSKGSLGLPASSHRYSVRSS